MIDNLQDLQALIKLCRSANITEISLESLHIKFGEALEDKKTVQNSVDQDPMAEMPSDEELAFYSSELPDANQAG